MKLGTRGLYQPIQYILHVQEGFIHVVCLGISNKSVAVPRQDSIRPVHCNIYTHCILHVMHMELYISLLCVCDTYS